MSDVVHALLAVTPLPPAGELDELLAALATMLAARRALLDAATPCTPDLAVLAELHAREAAWQRALVAARDRLQAQRIGAAKVRAYAAGVG